MYSADVDEVSVNCRMMSAFEICTIHKAICGLRRLTLGTYFIKFWPAMTCPLEMNLITLS